MKSIVEFREMFQNDQLPSIQELISDEAPENKEIILTYLKSFKAEAVAPGIMRDCITGERIPGILRAYDDGKFEWRSDMIYYFERYNIKLCDEFLELF